jgi:transcriptional regulator with XRE-family HTH domain
MPSRSPPVNQAAREILKNIAHSIRVRRQLLGISTVVAAHAAGISRVTWHRIEKAEPSVTIGAYAGALAALGLDLDAKPTVVPIQKVLAPVLPAGRVNAESLPAVIPIQKFRQLRQLAWHVKDDFELTPEEAFGLYDRYRRYLDMDQMDPDERNLLQALENAALKEHHVV